MFMYVYINIEFNPPFPELKAGHPVPLYFFIIMLLRVFIHLYSCSKPLSLFKNYLHIFKYRFVLAINLFLNILSHVEAVSLSFYLFNFIWAEYMYLP